MIDYRLLFAVALALGIPSLLERRWTGHSEGADTRFIDVVITPGMVGLGVGRVVALLLDDPASFGQLSSILVIRSGVDFWPGVIAAAATFTWSAWRSGSSPAERLAGILPLAIVGYGVFEASCLLRDGCFGPLSPVGLRPPGLNHAMVPIGLMMGFTLLVGAIMLRRLCVHRDLSAATAIALGLSLVALVRSVGSVWLPHLGDSMTRAHRTSIVVAAGALVAVAVLNAREHQRRTARVLS